MACGVEAACHVARASGTGSAAAALVCSSSLQGASLGRNCRVEPPEGSYYERLAAAPYRRMRAQPRYGAEGMLVMLRGKWK